MTHKRSPRTWGEVLQRIANKVGGRCQLNILVRTSGRKVWLECYFPRVAEWRALSPRLSHPQLAHWLDGFEKGIEFEEKNIYPLGRFDGRETMPTKKPDAQKPIQCPDCSSVLVLIALLRPDAKDKDLIPYIHDCPKCLYASDPFTLEDSP